jgi:glycosyltransferase involved in cell wall biosynthesis
MSVPVFLVGHRYGHHSNHSGYDGFSRYLEATALRPPVSFRFLKWKNHPMWGWRIDQAIGAILRRKGYSLGIFLTELSALLHVVAHRGALYHVLFGDTDVWLLGRLRRLTGTRVIATFHEADPGLDWLGIDRVARTLDAVVLVSESQRPYFERLLPHDKIFVVPHGMDTEFFRPADVLTREPICITVGGHTRDFETLARAIDLIRERRPDARFIAVGTKHGHDGRPFEHPDVEFHHGISDEALRTLYQSARVAVFSFRQTTANNATLEAMSCGVPVVCTDVGGAREYLGPDAGLLCPPHDAQGLADAVLRVFSNHDLARGMGAAGRQQASRFDFRLVSALQAEVYRKVAAEVG